MVRVRQGGVVILPNLESEAVTSPLTGSAVDSVRQHRRDEIRTALLVYHRDGAELVPLAEGAPVSIGRSAPSQVRLPDASLSREHARFTLQGGAILVEDLRSTNGTWVRGARVDRAALHAGEEIRLGRVVVAVRALAAEEGAQAGLMSHERFRVALEDEIVRARYFGRGVGVLMVRAARGAHHQHAHVSRWHARVRAHLRPVDRVALYSAEAVAILLPELGQAAVLEVARAIAKPDVDPSLLVGAATFPEAARAAEELLAVAWSAAQAAAPERPVHAAPRGAWTRSEPRHEGEGGDEADLIAASPAMQRVLAAVGRLARASIPVLLQGETGTGKEVIARLIHEQGPRRGRPMVCVNCGAIPQQLVESTLFGHERGAFTGASQQQKGVFEAADGGTVFLDEIGELPPAAQAALLRVLETKRVTRVGASREIEVDARIIAATHRDLEAMCEDGAFRLDLLYRLNTMILTLPALRARAEDIEPLADHFLRQALRAEGSERHLRGFEPEASALLRAYAWPGNVRELRNAIERAVVIAEGAWISAQDLPERVRAGATPPAIGREPLATSARSGAADAERSADAERMDEHLPPAPAGADLKARLQRYEAELIVASLRESGWNQTEAARRLGMPLRTLVHKLKTLGIKKLGYAPGAEEPEAERRAG